MDTPEPALEPCPDGEETFAAQVPADRALEERVQGAMTLQGFDHMTKIDVAAIGGTVCLRGQAATPTDSERAEEIASGVEGVANVVNLLQIPMAE